MRLLLQNNDTELRITHGNYYLNINKNKSFNKNLCTNLIPEASCSTQTSLSHYKEHISGLFVRNSSRERTNAHVISLARAIAQVKIYSEVT